MYMRVFYVLCLLVTSLNLHSQIVLADETYFLTQVEKPYSTDSRGNSVPETHPSIETPSTSVNAHDEKLTFKDGKVFFNDQPCNLQVDKIIPFSIDNFLVEVIDASGGDKKFNQFLKTKLHTDISQWKKEYSFRVNGKLSEYNGCKLLKDGITYRAANEFIVTDTDYFYRFVAKVDMRVQEIGNIAGYTPPIRDSKSCEIVSKGTFTDKTDYCLYTDDVDAARHINAKYKCFKRNSATRKPEQFNIYDTKKKCDDDYNFFLETQEYQG